jgi:hypothetical protein
MIRSRLCRGTDELVAITRQLYRADRFRFGYAADLDAGAWPGAHR